MIVIRIDKFLKNSRIIKRRSIAKKACEQGRVIINNKEAKPSDRVSIGDRIKIRFGNGDLNIEILQLIESSKKKDAEDMYKIIE